MGEIAIEVFGERVSEMKLSAKTKEFCELKTTKSKESFERAKKYLLEEWLVLHINQHMKNGLLIWNMGRVLRSMT